jgi:8-oxo-dGTP diphosphatase
MEVLENKNYLNEVSIDCVVFGYEEKQLKILIAKLNFKGDFYALPSGFIYAEEDIDEAAKRILKARLGIADIYLEEFKVFGKANKQGKEFLDNLIKLNYQDEVIEKTSTWEYQWFTKRFISIGYYALTNIENVKPQLPEIYESFAWYNIDEVPQLIMDHCNVYQTALKCLQKDLDSKLSVFNLLPEKFTMKDIQDIYETILKKEFVRANFQKKMLELNILERLEKKFTGAKNKAPYLYKLKG